MWLVILEIWSDVYVKECKTLHQAQKYGKKWEKKAAEAYPLKKWNATYYYFTQKITGSGDSQ